MLEEILYLLREPRSVPNVPNVVNNTTNRPSCSGGTAPTCTLDGMARINDNVINFPPIGLPTRVTEHTHGSLSQKTYAEGPAPGEKPETESPDGSPELEPSPEIELVRSGSPNDRKLPEPDEPRRHTVRLMSPGTRRNVRTVQPITNRRRQIP